MKRVTPQCKEEIRKAFQALVGSGIPEEMLARMLADHAIGLLEIADEQSVWFEASPPLNET